MGVAKLVGQWAMAPFGKALPPLGDTERAALEAGTVGFEGQLFAGRPDFDALSAIGPNRLSAVEQAFLDNELVALIAMRWQKLGLPADEGARMAGSVLLFAAPMLLGVVAGVALARIRRG